jgi:nucleoside-diphosphate-sugar epimerase
MRTLVTGLSGFSGHYIQAELEAKGHTVVGLSSDLTDIDAVATEVEQVQSDAVVHLAGIAFVGHGHANDFYDVNLIGTRNLLAALAKYAPNVQSILLASSANVYGSSTESVLNENVTPEPANDYAVSKLAMEHMARLWMEQLPLFITRPFNYTGVGQDENFLIPKIVSHFKEKKPVIELGNLDVSREFGDVRSVACSYTKLLKHHPSGQTINVCTGQTYSLREVISLCEKITGHNIELKVNPKFVRANEVRILTGDNTRLKQVIGDFQPYNLEDTLRWMLEEGTTSAK